MPTIISLLIGAGLTFMVLTYILGDNPLYRLALHLFIGILVGYSFGVALQEVFLKKVFEPLSTGESVIVVPIILGILLLIKGFPKYAYMGNYSVAYLVGVGTAVALSGALLGTLIPQVRAAGLVLSPSSLASLPFGIWDGIMSVVGTICTLMVFTFTRAEHRESAGLAGIWGKLLDVLISIGRIFLTIALAVAFAGALTASLSIFIGRIQYLVDAFTEIYFYLLGS